MRPRIVFLSILGALVVSGCESTNFGKYNPFGHYSNQGDGSSEVQMRADTGEVTPLPAVPAPATPPLEGHRHLGNASVDVFDMQENPQYVRGGSVLVVPPAMPSYGGGVLAADPSVTIFPLDGSSQMAGMAPMPSDTIGYIPSSGGNQIFFKHGSSRLGGGDMRVLSSVAEQAKFAPVSRITVSGYASQPTQAGSRTVEGHILNLKESMNRSFAVSKTLMQKGVPAEKIKTVSWGSTKSTGSERQDRRVDIVMGEQ